MESLLAGRDQALNEARARMLEAAETQKRRAADSLGEVAQALHQTARNIGPTDSNVTARYADLAADQVERLAQFLRTSQWQDMVGDAENFARRQPALFLGGAAFAGFILARFLKSSGYKSSQYAGSSGAYSSTTGTAPPFTGASQGSSPAAGEI
jgi:hypothetical protein